MLKMSYKIIKIVTIKIINITYKIIINIKMNQASPHKSTMIGGIYHSKTLK